MEYVEILVPACFFLFVYGIIELCVHRKERVDVVSKIDNHTNIDVINAVFGRRKTDKKRVITWACLLTGVGIGILIGMLICYCVGIYSYNSYKSNAFSVDELASIIYFGSAFTFGGIGLISSYIINKKAENK